MDEFRESRNLDIVRKLNCVIKVYFEKRNSGLAYKAKRNIIDYEDLEYNQYLLENRATPPPLFSDI
jgi:hypothetical protein